MLLAYQCMCSAQKGVGCLAHLGLDISIRMQDALPDRGVPCWFPCTVWPLAIRLNKSMRVIVVFMGDKVGIGRSSGPRTWFICVIHQLAILRVWWLCGGATLNGFVIGEMRVLKLHTVVQYVWMDWSPPPITCFLIPASCQTIDDGFNQWTRSKN